MKEKIKKDPSDPPLVSIIVITFNSSKYVVETLESAKNQRYNNIELIISDDFSVDNTVEICREWIKENSNYFKRSVIVANERNSGIAVNCNKGIENSKGQWIKLIAGDDRLIKTCIEDYVDFALKNKFQLFFAYPEIILEKEDEEFRLKREEDYRKNGDFFKSSASLQFLHLLTSDVLPMNPATIFFNKEFIESLGGFDETFLPEDLPLYLKATFLGNQLGIMEKNTVQYRIHNSSLSFRGKNEGAINIFWFNIKKKIKSPYITRNLFFENPFFVWEYYNINLWKELTIFFGNKERAWKFLRIVRLFSPLYILKKLNIRK